MTDSLIHPTAQISSSAKLGKNVRIGPYSIVEENVKIGDHTEIAGHVILHAGLSLGLRNKVFPFATLGGQPQSKGHDGSQSYVKIGDDNIIREQVTIHAGSSQFGGITKIGSHNFLMVGAHIAHDCRLGNHITMANNVLLGGHITVADRVNFGGAAVVQQFCQIGRGAMVGGAAALPTDLIPYGMAFGNHATLRGLNLIGLKRAGADRMQLRALRAFYDRLFSESAMPFKDRLSAEKNNNEFGDFGHEIIEFITAKRKQPLAMPG